MASYNMLAAGVCLFIACSWRLSLTASVEDFPNSSSLDENLDEAQYRETMTAETSENVISGENTLKNGNLSDEKTLKRNDTLEIISPTSGTPPPSIIDKNTTAIPETTKAATTTSPSVDSENIVGNNSLPTSSNTTATESDVDKSAGAHEKGPDQEPDDEIKFWWSDNTWLSIVIPVSAGLGSAFLLICWVCCVKWMCCRRCGRWRSPPYYKQRPMKNSGSSKKALREDFRQLRHKDRMKLLAESSDEEF